MIFIQCAKHVREKMVAECGRENGEPVLVDSFINVPRPQKMTWMKFLCDQCSPSGLKTWQIWDGCFDIWLSVGRCVEVLLFFFGRGFLR